MNSLPRVRWIALIAAAASVVTWFGLDFDFMAALNSLALKAVGLPALLLAAAKAVAEAMEMIDEEDPMYYTTNRSAKSLGFWRRVW